MSVDQPLSVQQLVSCDTYDYGCDGGYPVYGYKFIYDNGGVVLNASYPYVSYYDDVPSCQAPADNDNVVTLTDFYYFKTEAAMEAHVQSTGPLSICIDATDWSSYTSGVLSTCSDHVNHCVQAVGINSDEGYWIIRNSWGTEWGNSGYLYLETDSNLCDISYLPTYVVPTVSRRKV
jgi:C1A family cysteine protease